MSDEPEDDEELLEEGTEDDVSLRPNENADDRSLVERLLPAKIMEKYEVVSYRNAAVILSEARNGEFEDILKIQVLGYRDKLVVRHGRRLRVLDPVWTLVPCDP